MHEMNAALKTTTTWNKEYWPTGGAERAYLLVEVKGGTVELKERAPLNVSLVLDRSGSMEGEPLAYSKRACQFVIDQMASSDTCSLVVFDDQVKTQIEPGKVTHKDLLKQQIDSIRTGGSTNLSGGLLQGIQHVLQGKQRGSTNRVILLSDGHANEGITDRSKLRAIAKEYNNMGIGITAMGVGDGFDEELMEGIADQGGGNFYFIDKPENIPAIFNKELDGLLSVVAQNIQVTLIPSDKAVITNIYGYESERTPQGVKLALGDAYAEETKSILVEMMLYPHVAGTHEILKLQWEYAAVTNGEAKLSTLQYPVSAHFTNDIELFQKSTNSQVEKQIKITESAIALQHAIAAFDSGDEDAGKEMLQRQADTMLSAAVTSDDAELREEALMLYSQLENFSYTAHTRKTLHERKYRNMKRKK